MPLTLRPLILCMPLPSGAEAGDGRDESNKSLQERLADAQNAQTASESEAQQAEIRAKHLAKQLAETQKVWVTSLLTV